MEDPPVRHTESSLGTIGESRERRPIWVMRLNEPELFARTKGKNYTTGACYICEELTPTRSASARKSLLGGGQFSLAE